MFKLNPEQLYKQISKKLSAVYLLFGNDSFLIQESQDTILQIASNYGFKEHHMFYVGGRDNSNWEDILSLCQIRSLFYKYQILQIFLPENGSNKIINDQLTIVTNLLHKNLILIITGNRLTKEQEDSIWFKKISKNSVLVSCYTPEQKDLMRWVSIRAEQNQLQIDDSACQLLCYYYEGNLLALSQVLKEFSLLWQDGKITFSRVKKVVNDAAHFTPYHWIDAILDAKSKRALYILQHLYLEDVDPVILLRILQREIILLLILKRQLSFHSLRKSDDKHQTWKNRRIKTNKALNRLSQDQLRKAIKILACTELMLKQNYHYSVWLKLESISLLLCHKPLSNIFIDD